MASIFFGDRSLGSAFPDSRYLSHQQALQGLVHLTGNTLQASCRVSDVTEVPLIRARSCGIIIRYYQTQVIRNSGQTYWPSKQDTEKTETYSTSKLEKTGHVKDEPSCPKKLRCLHKEKLPPGDTTSAKCHGAELDCSEVLQQKQAMISATGKTWPFFFGWWSFKGNPSKKKRKKGRQKGQLGNWVILEV